MQQDPLPTGQSRVFIIGFDNFSFYFLPRRSRIVSRRTGPALDQPAETGQDAAGGSLAAPTSPPGE
ncbi:MAG: hypothetical protein VYD81_04465 [Planctomycetota bacterium]|nr:hypothetical protein [Planctomycetota bacterium]